MNEAPALPKFEQFHHVAFRCRDAAETCHFYRDVLGLPLSAGLAFDEISGTGTQLRYLHLFFELGDGSFIAFFDAPDTATEDQFKRRSGFNRHVAIQVGSLQALEIWQERLMRHGVVCEGPLDHGFVKSIYFYDPNGIQLEITARADAYVQIMAHEHEKADEELAAWTRRTSQLKQSRGLNLPRGTQPLEPGA